MKITFLSHSISAGGGKSAGGAQRSLHNIATALENDGFNIRVLTLASKRNIVEGDFSYDLVPVSNRLPRITEQIDRKIPDILSRFENDTDIFHMFGPRYIAGGGRYREHNGTPVVGRLNSYGVFCFNMSKMDGECHKRCGIRKRFSHYDGGMPKSTLLLPLMGYADQRIKWFNSVDALCAQSPAVEDIYRGIDVLSPEYKVIPNFYDSGFANRGNTPAIFPNNKYNCLYVGRFVAEKGIGDLIDAAVALPQTIGVHFVGDGPLHKQVSRAAGTHDNIFCHGFVEHNQLYSYYSNADLYIHPGRWPDPCPRTVLEAMAAETPSLVTDIGGPPWMVGDAGTSIEPGSPEAIQSKIQSLISNKQTLRRMKDNTETEISRFSRENIVSMYGKLYTSLSR